MKRFSFLMLGLLACAGSTSFAQESGPDLPLVRLELQPEKVAVGEAAQLRVTVLGPTWFPKPPVFPSFEIPNAIVRLPPDSSRPTSAQVDGERWSGVTRAYQVLPLMQATYLLGGETARVTVANPGGESLVADVVIPELKLIAEVPAGAEVVDPYIAGKQFRVRREIDGETGGLEAGDALVVRYIAELDGLPAIFLPPLAPAIESRTVSVYADEPLLSDGAQATRTEQTTLVMNYGGEIVLPALSFRWWNRETQTVEVASVDATTFTVVGPLVETATTDDIEPVDWRSVALAALVLAGIVYLLKTYLAPTLNRIKSERARYLNSEPFAFKQLQKACGEPHPEAIYGALLDWQQKLFPDIDLRGFARTYGNSNLLDCIDGLSSSLFAEGVTGFDPRQLPQETTRARKRFLMERERGIRVELPLLNPPVKS